MAQHGRRRAYGQHFLKDRALCQSIAESVVRLAGETECRALLEIGPGKGAITEPLAERLSNSGIERFIVSERDPRLVEYWQAKLEALPVRMELKAGDFLELPETEWLGSTPLAIASNLPYSAGTAILTRLARHPDKIPVMILMFQAEVAQRLRAEPGSKSWGSLSVWIQNQWEVSKFAQVPPGAFSPPPDVNSEVVILRARPEPIVPVAATEEARERWETLLRLAFAHRRKMLRSGLPPTGPWRNALERAAIDGTKRAEALSWDEWRRLEAALSAH